MQSFRTLLACALLLARCQYSLAFAPSPNAAVFGTRTTGAKNPLNVVGLLQNKHTPLPGNTLKSEGVLSLKASSSGLDDDENSPSWSFNPLFAAFWIAFFGFAALGPGEVFSPDDTALIQAYIENPSDPGFSEAFQLIFNYLGLMPIIIACTAVPQAAQRGLPPLPFLVASFGMGYGAVGPYLSFRAPPRDEYNPDEASWFTRNVLESKLLGWGLVAGVVGLPFYVGLVDAIAVDAGAAVQSYVDLFATSKLVSASSVDSIILNLAAATLIPRDLKLRQPDMEDSQAKLIGASTLLLPFLGAALYCALRPALPTKEN